MGILLGSSIFNLLNGDYRLGLHPIAMNRGGAGTCMSDYRRHGIYRVWPSEFGEHVVTMGESKTQGQPCC